MTDLDQMASELASILNDIEDDVDGAVLGGIRKGLKSGRAKWREGAGQFDGEYWKHGEKFQAGRYKRSITYHMLTQGKKPSGEIGSKKMPGLAHLLEKGHATIGGGRTRAFPHVAPASEVAFKDTLEEIDARLAKVGIK